MRIKCTVQFLTCVVLASVVSAQVSTEASAQSCKFAEEREGDDCPTEGVKFYLYTNKNPARKQILHVTDSWSTSNVSESFFNASNPTKIIIHGYNSGVTLTPLVFMRYRYLRSRLVNVIAVDWEDLSSGPCYIAAVSNARPVGVCLAQLISRLRDAGAKDIHPIGFSLGAHVPNYAAIKLRPYKLPRITGLDPAMPLFAFSSADGKLDPSDAHFVDVFHTNALIQGKMERSGHVDFYFNGGVAQPGCGANVGCSHQRAADYFAESIKGDIKAPIGFWAWPCPGLAHYIFGLCPRTPDGSKLAGEHCLPDTRGMYLVETRSKPPFAKGALKIKEEQSSGRPRCLGMSCLGGSSSRTTTLAQDPMVVPYFGEAGVENYMNSGSEGTTISYTKTRRKVKATSAATSDPFTLGIIRVEAVK